MMQPKHSDFTPDDVRIHYLEWGQPGQPPLLCLHGYLDIAHAWQSLAERLGDRYHVIAPDFRGHGDSGWSAGFGYTMFNYLNDWFRLADHLGWDAFHLVGHSMGANCASLMAGTFPQRIKRLAMVEGFGIPGWTPNGAPERLARHIHRRDPAHFKTNRTFDSVNEAAQRIMEVNPKYSPEHALALARLGTKTDDNGKVAWKFDPRLRIPNPVLYIEEQFRAFWGRITAPTLHILGGESPWKAMATPQLWNIADQRLIEIPNAMHQVHHDAPTVFNDAIESWLGGSPVGEIWPPERDRSSPNAGAAAEN